jgi:putative hemolysin
LISFLLPASIAAVLILTFLSALACYTLRDFSRSRLNDICTRNNQQNRFGIILKKHEDTLLSVEIFFLFFSVGLISLFFAGLGLVPPIEGSSLEWLTYASKWLLATLILVLTGGIFPWTISRVAGERFLYRLWPLLDTITLAMKPKLKVLYGFDRLIHRLAGMPEPPRHGGQSDLTDEIRSVVDEGKREGVLESEAGTMIHRVMELQEEDTAAIMTPRTEMNCISVESTLEEARTRLLELGHSRIPVIGETTDDIIGVLYAKDLLKHVNSANNKTVKLADIVREPFYVPETTSIANLLETLKRKRVHLAIVVDEYGGVAGLVTMEDVLEEIVGEIVDEYDATEGTGIRSTGPNVTEVEARVHIDDLNEQFDYELPEDSDYDTIGGFVFTQLGRVPEPNDSLTWNLLRITVLEADKRKIGKLRIEVDQTLAATASEEA